MIFHFLNRFMESRYKPGSRYNYSRGRCHAVPRSKNIYFFSNMMSTHAEHIAAVILVETTHAAPIIPIGPVCGPNKTGLYIGPEVLRSRQDCFWLHVTNCSTVGRTLFRYWMLYSSIVSNSLNTSLLVSFYSVLFTT